MSAIKIAAPYAEALLEIANSNNMLKEIKTDMVFISNTLLESGDLKTFLSNPLIKKELKKEVLKKAFEEKVTSQTVAFLLLLVDRGRTFVLDTIAQKFIELTLEKDSLVIAKVTSAITFSTESQEKLAEKLKAITGAQKIKFALRVDPALIGGFIVEIGSQRIDVSIRGRLKQLATTLGA